MQIQKYVTHNKIKFMMCAILSEITMHLKTQENTANDKKVNQLKQTQK